MIYNPRVPLLEYVILLADCIRHKYAELFYGHLSLLSAVCKI